MVAQSLAGSHIDGPPANGRSHLRPTPSGELHDLVCVGFGPASLAIAVALHDAIEKGRLKQSEAPKILFLEKQTSFNWHAGMLLPGARMQISFIKDLASLRDPRSHFTFLNFVHENGRLIDFINLGTFLPSRAEYDDYLRWSANHFSDVVQYGQQGISVTPVGSQPVRQFTVTSRNVTTGALSTFRSRNVVVAVGGQASIPKSLPASHPRVIHSSQFMYMAPRILANKDAAYRVAVVGSGQSSAEIFNTVQNLYPNSRTLMVMRSAYLKPSDDSAFVNGIFNPEFVDDLFSRAPAYRKALMTDARATNYGVVRLNLIEKLFDLMYEQRRELGPDETKWPHRILGQTDVTRVDEISQDKLRLNVRSLQGYEGKDDAKSIASIDAALAATQSFDVDLIVACTGYQRKEHRAILEGVADLLPERPSHEVQDATSKIDRKVVEVGRDYGVKFVPGKVAPGSGVWLQGCNEATHGLSDTLLSVVSTRSDEVVNSIWGVTPTTIQSKL